MDCSLEKNAHTMKDFSENILIIPERIPDIIETDRAKDFETKIFSDILNKNNMKRYNPYTALGVVFAKRFIYTFRNRLKDQFLKEKMPIGLMYYP